MKHRVGLLLAVAAAVPLDSIAFTTVPQLTTLSSFGFSSAASSTRLQYQSDAFRVKLTNAYEDWCQLHGHTHNSARKEIFCYHYLLAENFFQNTGVRLELNQHADLTDQEYASLLQEQHGASPDFKLSRPPAMEAEHQRFQTAYAEWCKTNHKKVDESRLEIFSYHHLMAERYLEETGTILQLNEYADLTQEEHEQALAVEQQKKVEPSTTIVAETATTPIEEPQPVVVPTPPVNPPQEERDFRSKEWWDGSGTSSNFADWWEGGSSLTSAGYERKPEARSARARWQERTAPPTTTTTTTSGSTTTPSPPKEPPTSKEFWGFLGNNVDNDANEQGSVAPAKTEETPGKVSDSIQGAVSPSSMTSYAQDETQTTKAASDPPLSSNPTTSQSAVSPSSMTSYVQDPAPTSRSPAKTPLGGPEATTPPPKTTTSSSNNSADWWGSGSIAQMKPIGDDTDLNENHKSHHGSSPGGEPIAPHVPAAPATDSSSSTEASVNPSLDAAPEVAQSSESSVNPSLDAAPEVAQSTEAAVNPSADVAPEVAQTSESSVNPSLEVAPEVAQSSESSVNPSLDVIPEVAQCSESSVNPSLDVIPEVAQSSESVDAPSLDVLYAVTPEAKQEYVTWCEEHGKEQTEARMKTFVRNLKWAREYSEQSGVELEMNEYSDLTEAEYLEVLAAEEDDDEEEEDESVFPTDLHVEPVPVVSADNDAGPSDTPSVLIRSKQRRKDMYEFQERLLAARIFNDLKLRERTKALAVQLKKYFFQRRLLAARIEYDAKANAIGAVPTQTTVEGNQVKVPSTSDVHEKEPAQALEADKQFEFQQSLLAARIKYDASAAQTAKDKQQSAFQQNLLRETIKNKFVASQQRTEEKNETSESATKSVSAATSDSKVSMQEQLYEAKVDNPISEDSKVEEVPATESIDKANKALEASATPVKSIDEIASAAEETAKVAEITGKSVTEAVEATEIASAVKETAKVELVTAKSMADEVVEAAVTTAATKSVNEIAETIEEVEGPPTSNAEKSVESVQTQQSENSAAVSISSSDELVFEYTSPYQGLTGPSKAGAVLAALLAIGMVVASPELDLASHVDWSQPGLTDFATLSGTAQHAAGDFIHNIQDGFAGATKSLTEGIQAASQKFMGGLETTKASTTRSVGSMSQHVATPKSDHINSLKGASDSVSEGVHSATKKFMGGLDTVKESTARSTESMSRHISAPKSDHTKSLKAASDNLSSWQSDRAQDIGKAAEKSTSVFKESTVSNVKAATNTIKEVKQNTPSVIKEIKPSTATNVVRELKQSPAASVIKEVKPSTAVKVVKDVATSSSDLSSMLSDWSAQQK